jgi:3-hydroxyisobutyrate dehydrogenase-like beta-hydroxyacid dehydrogenase
MSPKDRIASNAGLGFIGLGYLGSRIARRLTAAGFPVTVWNRNPARAAEFPALGAEVASDLTRLTRDVEVVLS